MNKSISVLLFSATLIGSGWAYADSSLDVIPELKEIERLAAEQEAKIRAQSEALKAAEAEKSKLEASTAAATTTAKEETKTQASTTTQPASSAQQAPASTEAPTSTQQATKAVKPQPAKAKTAQTKSPQKKDYWLMQERLYAYP